jgi:2-haloacid dehalogenase
MSDRSRRELIAMLSGALAGATLVPEGRARAAASARRGYRAIAFDGFALFDPGPIETLATELFPDRGAELVKAWRMKQFDYQWLQALAGRYRDFWESSEAGLVFAARALKMDLATETRDRLMHGFLQLKCWPDVPAALRTLKQADLRLAPLANLTPSILRSAVANSGLDGLFDDLISTDRVKTFKPDRRAYQLAIDVLRARREQILFVPSAGWDAAGSKWFGYPTFWVNRSGAPAEELGALPDGTGPGMAELLAFVKARVSQPPGESAR